MKRTVLAFLVLLTVTGGFLSGWAEGGLAFGFGGGGVGAFFPDLEGVNAFLSENGLDPMPSFLVGGGGGGRGGVLGGPSVGGMGFGVAGTSSGADRSAELAIGGGGFDLGWAVGGDESSVLTVGAVFGGGASVLELSFPAVQPQGIIPEPLTRTVGRAFGFVLPYVSFEAQILPFAGCEVRIGYVLPVFGFDFGEVVGIPAPSLDLSGPFVSVSIVFGGIGRSGPTGGDERQATASGTLELTSPARLTLETGAGEIVISTVAYDEAQTGSRRVVEWAATWDEDDAPEGAPPVVAESGAGGAALRSTGSDTVSYVLRVPAGTSLDLTCGAGAIHIVGHTAESIRVSLGVGEISLADVSAGDLTLSAGIGEIAVSALSVGTLNAHAGIGRLRLYLPPDVSATISASAGLGETSIEGFPGIRLNERRFLWTGSLDAVAGSGTAACSLSVGIGEVEVRATKPITP